MASTPRVLLALIIPLVVSTIASPVTAQVSDEDPFPGPGEVQDRLDTFAEHPWVSLHDLGESNEDRPIRVAEIVDPNGSIPVDERPVTLILTQQHGNEPAGTPAALRLMANITEGAQQAGWLDNQVLLVLAVANPDGAAAGTRGNADGVDTNRDHIDLSTPEARAMHKVLTMWDVDIALDHHEYGGTGPGNPVPVRTYDYDITTLYPVHGNVRHPSVTVTQELMYDGIWPEAKEQGFTVNEYGEVTANGEPVTELAGGPDPGILRNHLGLHNVAGLLVETRIDQHPNPFHPPERRIQAHTVVMEATVEHVHENAKRFTAARAASQQLAADLPAETYVEGNRTGPIAEAYQLPATSEVNETMTRHGIDPGTATDDGLVHTMGHPLEGHAAAIFHPASSRSLFEATPTEAPSIQEAVASTSAEDEQAVPLGASTALAALIGSLALARVRRVRS